jgi:hypothetical protein
MATDRLEKLQKSLLTPDKALEKLVPYEDCKEILVKGVSEFDHHPNMENAYVMRFGNSEFMVTQDSYIKLSRLVGIPAPYATKTPPQLLFPHLSYWLGTGGVGVKAFVREDHKDKDGRTIVSGFAREEAFYYPISRVFAQVEKVRPEFLVEGLDDVSWRNSTFGVVLPEHEFFIDLKKAEQGDYLYGGMKVHMSMLGEFPLKLSAFLLTLVCLNGAVSRDEVYTYNRKFGFDGLDEWVLDGVKNAITALDVEVEKVKRLAEIFISAEAISPFIGHIFDMVGVNQKTRKAVLENIINRTPRTLYELMNAVTEVTHGIENRAEVYPLQALGGFIASHADSCQTCHRPF